MNHDHPAAAPQPIEGMWRLVRTMAWNTEGQPMPPPYGTQPMGEVYIHRGRMIAALCDADPDLPHGAPREYNSYGGFYEFDGKELRTRVDICSRSDWLGSLQVRQAQLDGDTLILRPPLRDYNGIMLQRELHWERVWRP